MMFITLRTSSRPSRPGDKEGLSIIVLPLLFR